MALRQLARRKRQPEATIPDPTTDPISLRASLLAAKELIEVLSGQRGEAMDAAVTWQDLLDLQLIRYEEIPYDIGTRPFRPPGGKGT